MEKKGLETFPKKHIDPYDGMSITADVWKESHEEHRQALRAHDLIFHGAGIVYGLEVVANDPADHLVFISPGVAVDSAGYVVELVEPVAYDFSDSPEGDLYLVIGHGERGIGGVDNDTRYIQDEFVVAALPKMPNRPAVEIARIQIQDPKKPVKDAANPLYPLAGELDLRFRNEISPRAVTPALVGLVNLGGKPDKNVIAGWERFSAQVAKISSFKVIIDNNPAVIKDLARYQLVYLSGKGNFKVSKADLAAIKKYIKEDGAIILEALDQTARESCAALIEELGVKLKPASAGDKLLEKPYFFAAVPEGEADASVEAGKKFIYSRAAYSLVWAGKQASQPLSREMIRTLHEWGVNLIGFCLAE